MQKDSIKSYVKIIGAIIIILIYSIYIFRIFSGVPIDSDFANLVLEADDIVNNHNFFLNGWNQTGISFLTTDLLYFMIGVMIKGVSVHAYIIAVSLMTIMLMLTAMLLLKIDAKYSWKNIVMFIGMAGFPCAFQLATLRAHTGVYIWLFILIFSASKLLDEQENKSKIYYIIMFVSIFFGCIGDALMLITGFFAIISVCIYDIIILNRRKICNNLAIIGTSIGAFLASVIFDKLYYIIGNANKNSFLGAKQFETFDNYINKTILYFKSIFMLSDADFGGQPIVQLKTVFYFMHSLIVIIGLVLVIYNIFLFMLNKKYDSIATLLSIGFFILSVIFIITNISVDVNSSRYMGYTPLVFAILIIRFISTRNIMDLSIGKTSIKWGSIFVIIILINAISAVKIGTKYDVPTTEQSELSEFLESKGLTNGYASFWSASAVTVYSGGNVSIRAIIDTDNGMSKFNWFCKDEWYTEENNFIVVREPDFADFGITTENIIDEYGEPEDTLEFLNYKILLYDSISIQIN